MRLIDTSTLKLVSKRDDELPPYAILSHTWGSDEDEVSFEEMQSFSTSFRKSTLFTHPVARKVGFVKIQQSARLALSQGLQYIWIDTCCINKGSSAELSEAINSMFRWYQGSAVCYAFLSDVSVTAGQAGRVIAWKGNLIPHHESYSRSMYTSRWFTRGWTLQELVAPRTVDFYAQDWSLLGGKNDWLQGLISNITGIPEAVLDGSRSLKSLGIAERMHWASERVTTRVEDQAYCLMGIFDINMPLLYGEGKKAFIRLQEEILKVSDDQSLFAWTSVEAVETKLSLLGLLAPSPTCFRDTGHIVPLPPDNLSAKEPWTMTNIGLQVTLEVVAVADSGVGDVYAVLDCAFHGMASGSTPEPGRAAIRLKAIGHNQYARVQSHSVLKIAAPANDQTSATQPKQIFVKQQPVPLTPDIFLRGLEAVHAHNGRLTGIWPQEQWDAINRVVRPLGASRAGIIAAFRFKFDVQPLSTSATGTQPEVRSDLGTLDLIVGNSQMNGDSTFSSGSAWCMSYLSDGEQPLPNVVSSTSTSLQKDTSYTFHVETRPSIVFNVQNRGHAIISLSITTIQELPTPYVASAETAGIVVDPMAARYGHIAQKMTVEDSASLSLSDKYSSIYQLRIGRVDDSSPCREQMERICRGIQSSTTNIVVLKPDQATPDVFEAYFYKALVEACVRNDVQNVRGLVKSQMNTILANVWTSEVHTRFESFDELNILRGFRPLHWAALFGYRELAQVLIENGADPFLVTWAGLTPMHVAIMMEHGSVLRQMSGPKFMHRYASARMTMCDTLFNFAASFVSIRNSVAALNELHGLVDAGDESNSVGENILHRAAAMDKVSAATWALVRDARLKNSRDKRGRTPLYHAAAADSIEVCKILLDHSADTNIADELGNTPLCAAFRHGHREVAEMLLKARSSPGKSTDTFKYPGPRFNPWHFAALAGDIELLNLLGTYPVGAGSPDEDTEGHDCESIDIMTPLHIASSLGSMDCVMFLAHETQNFAAKTKFAFVRNSISTAKPRIETSEPRTAAQWARSRGFKKIAEFLEAASAEHST